MVISHPRRKLLTTPRVETWGVTVPGTNPARSVDMVIPIPLLMEPHGKDWVRPANPVVYKNELKIRTKEIEHAEKKLASKSFLAPVRG